MSKKPSDSIKSSPKKLCLETATYTFPDAVLSSILITAGNSPVIWTQSLEALRATCLVDVSGGWPMVFYSLCEMSIIPEAVSICKRTEWLFSFSDTYFWFDFELRRKVATRRFVCVCYFFQSAFVMWSLVCCFMRRWGAESYFVSLLVAFAVAVCFEWTFPCKMLASTIPASGWRFLLCWAWWCWVPLSLNGVDCGCCCGYWLLYHICRVMSGFSSTLIESLCRYPNTLWTSTHK